MNNKIYITTTLPYINSVPHIGHALELVQGDFISRYLKSKNYTVHFNTGVDEHGLKVYNAASKNGIETQTHCDNLAKVWQDFLNKFLIQPDTFWRTTSKDHKDGVNKAWNICFNKGDIYQKEYQGKYCIGCESFKTEKDLLDGKCLEHQYLDIKIIKENNYFFKLSNYKEHLLNWLDSNPDFLSPAGKREELRNLILDIEDISISRLKNSVPWGIEVPNDPQQNIYVWFEALCNYIISANWKWENTIQLCGPDNLRFQGIIWQGILKSLGYENTTKLLVHGTVLDATGNKISKSLGNVIDPVDQLNKYGLSAIRYYVLAGLPTYSNCNWNEQDLINLYNSHLANNFGNLINRVVTLIIKYDFKDKLSTFYKPLIFTEDITKRLQEVDNLFNQYEIKLAIDELNKINTYLNQVLTSEEPWKKDQTESFQSLNKLYWALTKVVPYYYNIIPDKKEALNKAIFEFEKGAIFPRLN